MFSRPSTPSIPQAAPVASERVRQSEASNIARIRRNRLANQSSYRNTILAGNNSSYSAGNKTLMGQ